MLVAGFQPLSLLDYPGHPAAIVFTQGCPFRCSYCHNPELIKGVGTAATLAAPEVIERLRKQRHWVDAVCVTGGEPTVQRDLPEFLRSLKKLSFLVKLDTNGVNLKTIQALIKERLVDYIAMDLKNTWGNYDAVARTGAMSTALRCRETFELIQASGVPHEFRTTICPGVHREGDFFEMASYLRPGERYFIQNFRGGEILDPSISGLPTVKAEDFIGRLREKFPDLTINAR